LINQRVLITETATNVQGKSSSHILDVNKSRDSVHAMPKINRIKGNNPYVIPENKNISNIDITNLKEPLLKEKKIKHAAGDRDYLKREMQIECKSFECCRKCNML